MSLLPLTLFVSRWFSYGGMGVCVCVCAYVLVLSKNVVLASCSASCRSLFVLIPQVMAVKRMCPSSMKSLQPGVLLVQARARFSVY